MQTTTAAQARAAAKAELEARILDRIRRASDGTLDSLLGMHVRSREKLEELKANSSHVAKASAIATATKKNITQYMVSKDLPTLVLLPDAEEEGPSKLVAVRLVPRSSRLLTPSLFNTLVTSMTEAEFTTLATQVQQDRYAAIDKWRAQQSKLLLAAAKKNRMAARKAAAAATAGPHKTGGVKRGRSYISKAAAASGMAQAAAALGTEAAMHPDVIQSTRQANKFVMEDCGADAAAAAPVFAAAAPEPLDVDESDADMEARAHAEAAGLPLPAELVPSFTARQMLVAVFMKKVTNEVRPLRPELGVRKMTKAEVQQCADRRLQMASDREQAAIQQWLSMKTAAAAARSTLKPRREELNLSLKLCEDSMRPLLEAKHAHFIHTARMREPEPDEEGVPLVRTISAKMTTREVAPKSLPMKEFQAMMQGLEKDMQVAGPEWDLPPQEEPFDPARHPAALLRRPASCALVHVLSRMEEFLVAKRRTVRKVCVRRARPKQLLDTSMDPYEDLETVEEGEEEEDNEDDDEDAEDGDEDAV
jgi:hypothetical protein